MEWIKCSEKMPPENEAVLCIVRYREYEAITKLFGRNPEWFMYALMMFDGKSWLSFPPSSLDFQFDTDFRVTDWMTLPAPPQIVTD